MAQYLNIMQKLTDPALRKKEQVYTTLISILQYI